MPRLLGYKPAAHIGYVLQCLTFELVIQKADQVVHHDLLDVGRADEDQEVETVFDVAFLNVLLQFKAGGQDLAVSCDLGELIICSRKLAHLGRGLTLLNLDRGIVGVVVLGEALRESGRDSIVFNKQRILLLEIFSHLDHHVGVLVKFDHDLGTGHPGLLRERGLSLVLRSKSALAAPGSEPLKVLKHI